MTDKPAKTPAAKAPKTDAAAPAEQPRGTVGPQFRILTQYVKDLSFENPRAPESLRVEGKPTIDLGVEMSAQGRPDGLFAVELKLSVKASAENDKLFQVELIYGGLFQLAAGMAEADIEPLLMIECPRYLFPYARQIIATATADGGFYPPFMLDPLDFVAIYAARTAQNAAIQNSPVQGQA